MRVKVEGRWRRMRFRGSVAGLLKRLGLNREVVVVKANERIVPETEKLGDGDVVEIVKVVFGG